MSKKNIVRILFLIFFALSLSAQEIRILSFNIQGKQHKGGTLWEERIANIIRKSGADIVCLQEVPVTSGERRAISDQYGRVYWDDRDWKPTFFKHILTLLGEEWDYIDSTRYSLRQYQWVEDRYYVACENSQDNAILYNKNKMYCDDQSDLLGFSNFKTSNFRFDKNSVVAARFVVRGVQSKSFYVVNVHLPSKNVASRQADVQTLKRLVSHLKQRHKVGVLVAGDFNCSAKNLKVILHGLHVDNDDGGVILTTISSKNKELCNDFDHFVYDDGIKALVTRRIRSLQEYYDFSYRKTTSDHLPVLLELMF